MNPFNDKRDPFDYINAPSTKFEIVIAPLLGPGYEYDWQEQYVWTPQDTAIPFSLEDMDTLPTDEIVKRILNNSGFQDHVLMWLDRQGSMVFIGDEMDHATMNREYYFAAIDDHDHHHGLTETAIWWM